MRRRIPKVGDRVRVTDYSEAHGDEGTIYDITENIWLIELDAGCIWPICGFSECELIQHVESNHND